jgi:hypothetical protein
VQSHTERPRPITFCINSPVAGLLVTSPWEAARSQMLQPVDFSVTEA